MSAENIKAFAIKARDDEQLKSKMLEALSSEDIVMLAAENGYDFTTDELDNTYVNLVADDLPKISVRRAGFRVDLYEKTHWFGWK